MMKLVLRKALIALGSFALLFLLVSSGFSPIARQLAPTRVQAQAPTFLAIGENIGGQVINTFNPINPASNSHIPNMEYDFLYSLNFPPLPFITPRMAQGYTVNSNMTQWTLALRPNLKWSDNTPINSTDLNYTLSLYNALGFFSQPPLKNWTIVNSTAIQVNTNSSGNFILYDLIFNGFGLLPKETFGTNTANITSASSFQDLSNVVADGAFFVTNYTTGENPITFQANPNYWQGPPHFSTLKYYLYSSASALLSAYQAGQIDIYSGGGPFTNYQPVANMSGHTLVGPPQAIPGHTMGIEMNDWTWPFNVTAFRQGLAYGTNITQINDEINGPFSNASFENHDLLLPVYNRQIGFGNDTGPVGYTYNVTKAKAILGSVPGFKYSGSTLEYSNGSAVTFTMKYNTAHPWAASTATLVDNQWKAIGIATTLIAQPQSTENTISTQPNPVNWQVLIEEVTSGLLNNWGVTPGPSTTFELGTYEVPVNGTETFWNSTYGALYSKLITEQNGSSQFNADARTLASYNAYDVPVIPLYNVFGMLSITNSIYWGSPTNYTGIYNTQAETGPAFWDETLWIAQPVSGSSTSSSSSSSGPPSSTNSTSVSATGTSNSTSVVGPPSTTSTGIVPSSSSSTSSTNNTTLYIAAGVIILIIIIVAAIAMMRRRRPGAPAATTTTPPP